jgi:drug/metabolite transporter, DME family
MAPTLVLLAAVLFGTTGTAQTFLPADTSPLAVGALRIALGGAVLAAVAAAAGGRRPLGALRPRPLVVLGGLAVAAYQPAFFAGVRSTGVAVGTLVALGSAPAMTGVLEWVTTRRAPSRRWAAATGLAAGGVAVLALGGPETQVRLAGVGYALGAGAAYAGYTIASKRLLDAGHAAPTVMGALFGLGGVLLAPALVFVDTGWVATPAGLTVVLWLGLVPTALAYVLFARGLARLPAGETATLTLAEPVTAAALAVVVLGEAATIGLAAGAVLVAASVLLLAWPVAARLPVAAVSS